ICSIGAICPSPFCSLLGLIDILTGCLPCLVQSLRFGIHFSEILHFMSLFQCIQGGLDGITLLLRDLFPKFRQLLVCLEDQRISHIHLISTLTCILVCIGVGLSFSFHALYFLLAETCRCFDAD